jgi:hypothetical protein
MGLEENSVNGSGAMDEEERRQTENDLIKHWPDLKTNPALLKVMVEAVGGVRGSALRDSEALDSQGRVHGSDLGQDTGFFSDMEGYRRQNMTAFPPEAEQRAQSFARIMATENSDPNPEFGMSPGNAFVKKALAGTDRQMEQNDDGLQGNTDPNPSAGGGKSVFDDREGQPGNPNPNPGKPWIRNLVAPGRGLRRR